MPNTPQAFSARMIMFAVIGLLNPAVLPLHADAAAGPEYSRAEIYPPTTPSETPAPSLTHHLQLTSNQVGRLDRIYDAYITRRRRHEADIARWRQRLSAAQQPASFGADFDADAARDLLQKINAAQLSIADDLLASRAQSHQVLSAVQRSQLESLATDTRIRIQTDQYFELLLQPVEQSAIEPEASNATQAPQQQFPDEQPASQQEQRERRGENRRTENRRNRGSGSYGVYGGYSYGGPSYGVYGSYGKGPVGVHAGIGRGGPSVGVSIGGVFSRWRR